MRVFENKVLRKIFGAKRDEVTGEWRKLHNAELHGLYPSPDIIRNIKSRRLRWAGHVARMGESRNAYRVLVGRPEGKRPLGRPRRRWEDNIKMDLREVGYDDRDWINLAQDRDQWRAYVRVAMNSGFLKSHVDHVYGFRRSLFLNFEFLRLRLSKHCASRSGDERSWARARGKPVAAATSIRALHDWTKGGNPPSPVNSQPDPDVSKQWLVPCQPDKVVVKQNRIHILEIKFNLSAISECTLLNLNENEDGASYEVCRRKFRETDLNTFCTVASWPKAICLCLVSRNERWFASS
ncbi:hypothetical protein ANN_24310 [Periplaneta americana]|uniref:Uncharacterized protein n=1 Tax=Periplaneta americana TaxID=6978 RepID=A0ABQ8S2S4_PERAM|nr:hypothetical protein ANN_24310 [Periplaneta americana]